MRPDMVAFNGINAEGGDETAMSKGALFGETIVLTGALVVAGPQAADMAAEAELGYSVAGGEWRIGDVAARRRGTVRG